MKKRLINKLFIYAFLFLYVLVAFISFCHAIEFFDIGNVNWMSVMLAFAFELGLAVCLASILIGTNKKNNIAWILLTILVIVQVVGNTYSVFKYIAESNTEYYSYLAKPLLFFIEDVSEETVQIIISWIMGAILPVVALLMTEMVANGIREQQMDDLSSEQKEAVTEPVLTYSEDNNDNDFVMTNYDEPNNNDNHEKIDHEQEINDEVIDDVPDVPDVKEVNNEIVDIQDEQEDQEDSDGGEEIDPFSETVKVEPAVAVSSISEDENKSGLKVDDEPIENIIENRLTTKNAEKIFPTLENGRNAETFANI